MGNKPFILNLGKLLIAAAWADGELTSEEINALKELLFLLPEISGQEWMELEIYMASPVGEQERQQLLGRVLDGMTSQADKSLVIETLEKIMESDGAVKPAEASVIETLRQDVEGKSTGLLSHLSKPFRQALQWRAGHYEAGGRESRLEDFIKNAIYFQLVSELNSRGITLSLSDQEIRKVCLAAGIMARVAWVDQSICEQEQDSISHALAIGWQLPEEHARLITEISHHRMMKGLDSARMTKGFCECTTIPERKAFVKALFAIANAAHKTSHQEIEEIRTIAKALELSHQDFIEAKLTISKDDRGGL